MVLDGIEVIGTSNQFPDDLRFFKEELIWTSLENIEGSPEIGRIVSVSVDTNIVSYKILDIDVDHLENDESYLNRTIRVELNFYIRIKYIGDLQEQYIYTANNEITKVIYISMPNIIDNLSIEELVRQQKIRINPYISDIYAREKDANSIYLRILCYLGLSISQR